MKKEIIDKIMQGLNMDNIDINYIKESDYIGKLIKTQVKMSKNIGFYEVIKFDRYISCKLIFILKNNDIEKKYSDVPILFNSEEFFNKSEFLNCTAQEFEQEFPEYFL